MTLPATLFVPEFIRLERNELNSLLHVLRDPLTTHVYMLLCVHMDFKSGEFLGGYHRLMELCTPPQPERGRRRAGPTYWQLRRVVDDLISHVSQHFDRDGHPTIKAPLAHRDARGNAAQGQLRIHLQPREKNPAPASIPHRINRRLMKSEKLDSARLPASPMDDKPQDIPQGFQGVNTLNPLPLKTPASCPQPEAAKAAKAAARALLQELKSSPPGGGRRKAPPGGIGTTDVPY